MLVNLTPHPLRFFRDGVEVAVVPPSGQTARIATTPAPSGDGSATVDGVEIPVSGVGYGQLTGLPEPQDGVLYVVPLLTALAAPADRTDLVVPHEQVRNSEGTVVGCASLGRVAGRPHELLAEALHGWAVCDSILAGANGANPRIAEIRREAGLAR